MYVCCIRFNVLVNRIFNMGPESSMKLFKGSKPKCVKCGVREPTDEDGLCDSCRYLALLVNVVESRTAAVAS
jgi:hypothetical protein